MIEYITISAWWMICALGICAPQKIRSYATYSALILLMACMVMSLGCMTLAWYYTTWYERGSVKQEVILRVGPNMSYGSCGILKQGEEVIFYTTHGSWVRIGKDLMHGWVPRDQVSLYEH